MNYIESIATAFLLFPFIAFIFTIPFILHNYHKYGSIHFFRVLIIYSFILYLITIYFLVILPLPTFEEALKNTGPYINLNPFKFINDFIRETPFVFNKPNTYLKTIIDPSFYIVAFNILMFIPLGMYLHYYFEYSLKKTILYAFLLSLFFELTQLSGLYFIYPNPYRLCDIDDLIINTLGGIIGYLIMGALDKYFPSREKIDEESLKNGEVVSGFRRITICFLDLFLYLIFTMLLLIFIKKYTFIISFIIYFLFFPFINKNATIGMKFLNVKMKYEKVSFLYNIYRYIFLIIYYIGLPIFLMVIIMLIRNYYNLINITFILYGVSLIFIILFYLINFVSLIINKTMFYDKLFKFKYVSTINKMSTFN